MIVLQVVGWLVVKGTHLLGLNDLICTFDQKLNPTCVCLSLDVLHQFITQHDGFNNLNFIWRERGEGGGGHLINQGYSPRSCIWINEVIHCWHCKAQGHHLKRWWGWEPLVLSNLNLVSSPYSPSHTINLVVIMLFYMKLLEFGDGASKKDVLGSTLIWRPSRTMSAYFLLTFIFV